MSRVPSLSSPFLLGFDEIERVLDRVAKGADGSFEKYEKAIDRILKVTPIDTLQFRSAIAQKAIETEGYAL